MFGSSEAVSKATVWVLQSVGWLSKSPSDSKWLENCNSQEAGGEFSLSSPRLWGMKWYLQLQRTVGTALITSCYQWKP